MPLWPIDELVEWAAQDLAHEVVRRTPWASVVRWPGSIGSEEVVWGKAMCPGFASECRVLMLLERRTDLPVLAPLRVDPARGLLLLPDGGPTFDSRSDDDSASDVSRWTDMLTAYAALQQEMVGTDAELVSAGCVDLRPAQAVERLAEHMHHGLIDGRPHLVDWLDGVAARLSADVPATIQHDDLAPSNVLLDGRLLDWGDASLAHPFASLLSALMPGTSTRPGSRGERTQMADAYLRSWASYLGLDARNDRHMAWLGEQAHLAMLLAPIGRIDTWLRAPVAALTLYPDAIDRWIRHLEASFADPRSTAL